MDCSEYIGEYLAAQADEELTAGERRAAEEHLARCAGCRALLAEERAAKVMLRRYAGIVRTPPEVRLRISAALGEAAEAASERRAFAANREAGVHGGALGRAMGRIGRNGWLAQASAAAAVVIVVLALLAGHLGNRRGAKPEAAVQAFDLAINKYLAVQRFFAPNLPTEAYSNANGAVYAWVQNRTPVERVATETSDALDDVARAYREMSMPDDLLDLSPAGYALSGARAERLPDGRPVTYTLYSGAHGTILNICYPDSAMAAPVGAISWVGMRSFYEYKGYSICMSFYPAGHFVSILLSRMPVTQLIAAVATADATVASR